LLLYFEGAADFVFAPNAGGDQSCLLPRLIWILAVSPFETETESNKIGRCGSISCNDNNIIYRLPVSQSLILVVVEQ
jgi:hypothetical protein